MRKSSICLITNFCLVSLACSSLSAQDALENFIERDSAAFIVIEEPDAVLEQIESSVFFENRHFKKATELIVDGRFPLATAKRLEELKQRWNEVRELLAKFDEVSVIVHHWPDDYSSIPEVSIVLAGSKESTKEMKEHLAALRSAVEDADADEPDFFTQLAGDELSNLSVQQVGNLILLSNSSEKSEELKTRIERAGDRKFKSLSRNRSYQTVQKLRRSEQRNRTFGVISHQRVSVDLSRR